MKCPKCGYLRQSRDDAFAPPTECPACGIVYAKFEPGDSEAAADNTTLAVPAKKQSAVDESTLRKARERVERRLRNRTATQAVPDDERERMLKQARILAAEGVRKRQQEWQQRQTAEPVEPDAVQAALDAQVDAALQEGSGSETDVSADRLVYTPVAEVKANEPALFVDDTQRLTSPVSEAAEPEPELELEDTISEQPVMPEPTATMQAVSEPEPMPQTALEEAPATEESGTEESTVTAIAARPEAGAMDSDETQSLVSQEVLAAAMDAERPLPKAKAAGFMRFFQAVAWLILVAGLSGAVLSWFTLTDVQAGTQSLGFLSASNLPMALLLAFAYLAIGVLGFAFFWVASLIGGQLTEIRKILLQGNPSA
jgi:hypothetical protein